MLQVLPRWVISSVSWTRSWSNATLTTTRVMDIEALPPPPSVPVRPAPEIQTYGSLSPEDMTIDLRPFRQPTAPVDFGTNRLDVLTRNATGPTEMGNILVSWTRSWSKATLTTYSSYGHWSTTSTSFGSCEASAWIQTYGSLSPEDMTIDLRPFRHLLLQLILAQIDWMYLLAMLQVLPRWVISSVSWTRSWSKATLTTTRLWTLKHYLHLLRFLWGQRLKSKLMVHYLQRIWR